MGWLSQGVVAALGLVTARCFGSGVFRGGVICVRFRGQSGRVTHPTKRRSIPRGMGVPPVRVLEKPVGCVSRGAVPYDADG